MRLILICILMTFSQWTGMAYAHKNMGLFFAFAAISSLFALVVYAPHSKAQSTHKQ